MIVIFNNKLGVEIRIDDTLPFVTLTPRDYDDSPYVKIELKGFHFFSHANECKDCKAFLNSFGTTNFDWFVSYLNKTKRLDLSKLNKQYDSNNLNFKISEFDNCSTFKLNLSLIPENEDDLKIELEKEEKRENYEMCIIYRDILREL